MPTAILSVYDKSGLVPFARGLQELGWKLLASGGTARTLKENGIHVTEVSDYTGSPEILDGRVKTLHPAVHGGLLARPTDSHRQDLAAQGWGYIDLVACNLYPFTETISEPGVTLAEAIEQIDIGGVTLVRAAAKNFERVTLVCDPGDYGAVLDGLRSGGVPEAQRKALAVKGFALTAQYDAAIFAYLTGEDGLLIHAQRVQELRYGENPHQKAALYAYESGTGPLGGELLQGKPLSYNNLLDLDAAWRTAASFEVPTIAIIKHLSPCGIASGDVLAEAYRAALASDPVSAFGSVIACNREIDGETAAAMNDLFIECIAAPGFREDALEGLSKKKNCRLLKMPNLEIEQQVEFRSIVRGMLRQQVDVGDPVGTTWRVVTRREPTAAEWEALRFAWKACQHAKSNAIVFAKDSATVGVGSGQPNRVDCVHIAAQRAGDKAKGAVMASDAFFPFPDAVEAAQQYGIQAIVQPGGSIRDELSIEAADKAGMAMVFTGVRHFRH